MGSCRLESTYLQSAVHIYTGDSKWGGFRPNLRLVKSADTNSEESITAQRSSLAFTTADGRTNRRHNLRIRKSGRLHLCAFNPRN